MKIICLNRNGNISLRPDSAILRENDDFYLPDFSEDIVCLGGIAVRVDRLAKCVEPRFASRLYNTIFAGVAFTARDIMQRCLSQGVSCDEAYCFDRSMAISPVSVPSEDVLHVSMQIGDEHILSDYEVCRDIIDSAISRASNIMTLKTGDIVFLALSDEVSPQINDHVSAALSGVQVFDFEVK